MSIMSRITGIFGQRRVEPEKHETHLIGWPVVADSGVPVTEDTALSCSVAFACGSLIARSLASLPARVMAPRGDHEGDGNERLVRHPVEALLNREPNSDMTAFQWREGVMLSVLFTGNHYSEIERDGAGRPIALWPIASDRVQVRRDEDGQLFYEVYNGYTAAAAVPAEDVFHVAGPSLCGAVGMSLLTYGRQALGLGLAQQQFANSFLKNAAAPSGMMKVNRRIEPDGLKRLRAELDGVHAGSRRAGRIMIGDEDMTWIPLGVSPADAEFLGSRQFQTEEIARFFNVPPQLIGDMSKATLNNYEMASLQFATLTLTPWAIKFEQEAGRKLLRRGVASNRSPFLKLNLSSLVRADIEKQTKALALGRMWGWMSANDCRRLLDLEPLGPEGDEYLRPLNMQPAGDPPPNDDGTAEEDRRRAAALRRVS